MKKQEAPKMRPKYDWRNGVCQFCEVSASNGCCKRHQMNCQSCNGFGSTTKEAYQLLREQEENRRNNPPNPCCKECTADFNHSVGSHSDDRGGGDCDCLKGKCDFPNCFCHSTPNN